MKRINITILCFLILIASINTVYPILRAQGETVKSDLFPSIFTFADTVSAQQTISISWTVTNQGGTAAQPPGSINYWVDNVWFSTDTKIDTGTDLRLIQIGIYEAPLTPTGSYSRTIAMHIPSVDQGTYYLILDIDNNSFGNVDESDETNNVVVKPLSILTSDLAPTAFTFAGTVSVQQTIPISWTATNQGSGPVQGPDTPAVNNWVDNVWFSTDTKIDPDTDLRLIHVGIYDVPLNSMGSYSRTIDMHIPAVDQGIYYLILDVDTTDSCYQNAWFGNVYESNEGNNIIVKPINVQTSDLAPVSFTFSRSTTDPNKGIFQWTAINQGSGSVQGPDIPIVSNWVDRIWLSADTKIDTDIDRWLLIYGIYESPLNVGKSYTETAIRDIPPIMKGYLILEVDTRFQSYQDNQQSGNVYESNEGNNLLIISVDDLKPGYHYETTTLNIQVSPPTVDKYGASTAAISGQLIEEKTNNGISGKRIFLSYIDTTEHQIFTPTQILTGENGYYSYQWDVPANVPNGQYIIKAFFNADDYYTSSQATTIPNLLFVVPEYLFGGLAAIGACFAGFAVFKKSGSLSTYLK